MSNFNRIVKLKLPSQILAERGISEDKPKGTFTLSGNLSGSQGGQP